MFLPPGTPRGVYKITLSALQGGELFYVYDQAPVNTFISLQDLKNYILNGTALDLVITQGALSLPNISQINLSGDGVTLTDGGTGVANINIPGGGSGAAWAITDGTHSVTDVSLLTVSGATVGGTSPNATLTITPSPPPPPSLTVTGSSLTIPNVATLNVTGSGATVTNPSTGVATVNIPGGGTSGTQPVNIVFDMQAAPDNTLPTSTIICILDQDTTFTTGFSGVSRVGTAPTSNMAWNVYHYPGGTPTQIGTITVAAAAVGVGVAVFTLTASSPFTVPAGDPIGIVCQNPADATAKNITFTFGGTRAGSGGTNVWITRPPSAVTTTSGTTLPASALVPGALNGNVTLTRSGPTANFADTTDTAANWVAAWPSPVAGANISLFIRNKTAFLQTINPGAGVTIDAVDGSGTLIIGPGSSQYFAANITNLGTPAVTIYA